ncbi:unnamed protein product [Lactuca saligna]|uniref:Uncharacterized protein n=1 Tax=Lactuca saligna TaxID=75948 RepID=A0AA35YSQ7_LACSI|nr:unnamed protein product [Lactuca saligna]
MDSHLHQNNSSAGELPLIKAEQDELKAREPNVIVEHAQVRHATVKSFMEIDFASYLPLGELDIGGLPEFYDDLDTKEGQPEGGSSYTRTSSTPQAVTVIEPLAVLNLIVPCNVDEIVCSRKRASHPRIISSSGLFLTTENSIIFVTISFPSWLSSVNMRFLVPRSYSLCPVKPTYGA